MAEKFSNPKKPKNTMNDTDPAIRLANARAQLANVPAETRSIYTNHAALVRIVADMEANAVALTENQHVTDCHVGNAISGMIGHVRGPIMAMLGTARAMLNAIEQSPKFAAARDIVVPILEEIDAASAAENDALRAISLSQQARAQALAAARAKAMIEAEKDASLRSAEAEADDVLRRFPILAERQGLAGPPPQNPAAPDARPEGIPTALDVASRRGLTPAEAALI